MNDQAFQNRLAKAISEVEHYKTNQALGGDSWTVYRSSIDFQTQFNKDYRIRFSPQSSRNFVATCYSTPTDRSADGTLFYIVPDPDVNGVWYLPWISPSSGLYDRTFFVYSTVKGEVSVEVL